MNMRVSTTLLTRTLILDAPKPSVGEKLTAFFKRAYSGARSSMSRIRDYVKNVNTRDNNSVSLKLQWAHKVQDHKLATRFPDASAAIKAIAIPSDLAKTSGAQRKKITNELLRQKTAIALHGNTGAPKLAMTGRPGNISALIIPRGALPEMAVATHSRPKLMPPPRESAVAATPNRALQQRCDALEQKFRALSDGVEADAINHAARNGSDADLQRKVSSLTRMLALYSSDAQA